MHIIPRPIRYILALSIGCCCCDLGTVVRGAAVEASPALPPIIQAGFTEWPRGGASASLDVWKKGGLMEGDRKVLAEVNYFKRLEQVLGGYKSFELIQAQRISSASELIYLAINFERTVVYARFLLYRTEQDWVVQNMDFNAKPEAVIPWLALPGTSATD